ncbi:hypothetical protein HYR54_08770 [Candidatus Acetothermia bacterium]|nr:hypothetical protein [Candidatus Acetothermia bacterium]
MLKRESPDSVAETLQSGWQANTPTCQNVTIAAGETKTLNFGNSLLCTTGVTAFSSPHSVTYRPTSTRPSQKTIIVTLATSSSTPVTVDSILPKDGQPFTIVSITPALPVTLGSADRLAFTVVTQRAAGLGNATATSPYFNIGTSCGLITTASELTQVVPLTLKRVLLELQAGQLRFEALGIGIKQINVQVFSLSGKRVYTSGWVENGHEWSLEDINGRKIANGVYLYVTTVRGYDGSVRTQVKKLVITQ